MLYPYTVMKGVLVAIEFLVFFGCSRFYLIGQINVFVHAVFTVATFLSAGADFRVCTRCVGYNLFYLLGQIFHVLYTL